MNLLIWILSGLLAAAYLGAGLVKLTQTREKLLQTENMAWAEDFDAGRIKAIGAVEVLGALGLVLPWLLDVAPVLTPIAASGLVAVQVGAIQTHLRRGEKQALPVNVALLVLALVVAVLRFSQL